MYRAYRTDPPSAKAHELAEKITALVVASDVTYQDATDALSEAQELLMQTTKPVSVQP